MSAGKFGWSSGNELSRLVKLCRIAAFESRESLKDDRKSVQYENSHNIHDSYRVYQEIKMEHVIHKLLLDSFRSPGNDLRPLHAFSNGLFQKGLGPSLNYISMMFKCKGVYFLVFKDQLEEFSDSSSCKTHRRLCDRIQLNVFSTDLRILKTPGSHSSQVFWTGVEAYYIFSF